MTPFDVEETRVKSAEPHLELNQLARTATSSAYPHCVLIELAGHALSSGWGYSRAWPTGGTRRSGVRAGTTTYFGSRVDSTPASNTPNRCNALPASSANPDTADHRPPSARRPPRPAPLRPSSTSDHFRSRCALPVVYASADRPEPLLQHPRRRHLQPRPRDRHPPRRAGLSKPARAAFPGRRRLPPPTP